MKYKELINADDNRFNLFQDGFYESGIEVTFLTELEELYSFRSAIDLFDEYVHNLLDDEDISPVVKARITDDNKINTANARQLAQTIIMRYGIKWNRLWRDYYNPDEDNWINTYNPIENYDRHETNGGSDVVTGLENDNKQTSSRYGFNSSTAVPVNESTEKNKQSTEYGHTLHTHGNIGVTTTAQMLEQDRNLWTWSFIDEVIKDLQHMLTLSIYENEVII